MTELTPKCRQAARRTRSQLRARVLELELEAVEQLPRAGQLPAPPHVLERARGLGHRGGRERRRA
ncbi:MAG: hypothetical protein M3Q43_12060, partial [Actinomycetota bacterium]|nr:hypothetical protein [Actinomycetota bacterium]